MIDAPDWEALLPSKPTTSTAATDRNKNAAAEKPESLDAGRGLVLRARALSGDDRRRCVECAQLTERGTCMAAHNGEIVALKSYTPIQNLLRRCEGFKAVPGDTDQRCGRDRWPGL